MGRPPLPDGEGRTAWVQLRLTESEKESYRLAAEQVGVPLSDWIRECLDKAAVKAHKGR